LLLIRLALLRALGIGDLLLFLLGLMAAASDVAARSLHLLLALLLLLSLLCSLCLLCRCCVRRDLSLGLATSGLLVWLSLGRLLGLGARGLGLRRLLLRGLLHALLRRRLVRLLASTARWLLVLAWRLLFHLSITLFDVLRRSVLLRLFVGGVLLVEELRLHIHELVDVLVLELAILLVLVVHGIEYLINRHVLRLDRPEELH
jgi:hypothetical protein